jgi:tetratricopeptide (TPR) repeat protein
MRRWRYGAAVGVLLVSGAVRLPLERTLEAEWERLHLRGPKLDLGIREEIGQMSYVAALGGFRSLVATFLTLKAHIHWQNTEYVQLGKAYDLVVGLQPRTVSYWEDYGWHRGWNERSYYLNNQSLRPALRRQLADEAGEAAREILDKGIRNNPEDYTLYLRQADLLRDKLKDPCAAAGYFEQAAVLGGPTFTRRFAAYMLAKCPGREREALRMLRDLYVEGREHHKPTLVSELRRLEEELAVPPRLRVSGTGLQGEGDGPVVNWRAFLNGNWY